MSNYQDLNKKLAALKDKLETAEKKLELKKVQFKEDHSATRDELLARYTHLQEQLADETADMETNGLHIGELEKSVLAWMNGLDFDN